MTTLKNKARGLLLMMALALGRSGIPKAGACTSRSGVSESQQRKPMINATQLDTKVRMRQPEIKSCGPQISKNDCPSFVCEICVEPKKRNKSFSMQGCSHAYCTDRVVKHVSSKLRENITSIPCPLPNCKGLLEPEYCRSVLPQDVFDRWGVAISEAMVLGAQKFYGPFKDCSALLINDGGEVIKESECPHCNRLFCAQCKVPWHAEIDCTGFQSLNKDEREREDIVLMKLAQQKKWKKCPNCRYYVEKKEGCMYMKCRCGKAFCYNCGARSNSLHLCPK